MEADVKQPLLVVIAICSMSKSLPEHVGACSCPTLAMQMPSIVKGIIKPPRRRWSLFECHDRSFPKTVRKLTAPRLSYHCRFQSTLLDFNKAESMIEAHGLPFFFTYLQRPTFVFSHAHSYAQRAEIPVIFLGSPDIEKWFAISLFQVDAFS